MFDNDFYFKTYSNTHMSKRDLEHFLKKEMGLSCQRAKYIASKCGRKIEPAKGSYLKRFIKGVFCGK